MAGLMPFAEPAMDPIDDPGCFSPPYGGCDDNARGDARTGQ